AARAAREERPRPADPARDQAPQSGRPAGRGREADRPRPGQGAGPAVDARQAALRRGLGATLDARKEVAATAALRGKEDGTPGGIYRRGLVTETACSTTADPVADPARK